MQAISKSAPHSQYPSYLLLGLVLFFVGHFLLLSPSSLEDDFGGMRVIEPKDLLSFLKNEPKSLVPDLPTDIIPAYSLRESEYFSSDGTRATIKMNSRKSNLYQKESLIHSRDVVVELSDGTLISAKEAVFYQLKNQIDFYGSVHAVLTNGAELDTEFATVLTRPKGELLIPKSQHVTGHQVDGSRRLKFESQGLTYRDLDPKVLHLLSEVRVQIQDEKLTLIRSDQAVYQEEKGNFDFVMNDSRPMNEQFVLVTQPDLEIKSRKLVVTQGTGRSFDFITADQDVHIRDSHDPKRVSTSTSGRAVYDQKKNDVLLSDFPQVYQDGDTVTGDIITFHRSSDTIEVKQSNAIYHNDEIRNESFHP